MATLMAQPGVAGSTSRQDVISALLNDYASFSPAKTSPFSYTASPVTKDLPPPPPSNDEKPLPPVMTMRFQLRVDEPQSPRSFHGDRSPSLEQQPRRIQSRFISRSSKPPSLKLLTSNGATAFLPKSPKPSSSNATPIPKASRPAPPAPRPPVDRPLPDIPPPPPAKSERRFSQRRPVPAATGNRVSNETKDGAEQGASQQQPETLPQPVVKRKPMPPTVKKFKSLAELGTGPRGNKYISQPTEDNTGEATITPASLNNQRESEEEAPPPPAKPENPFLSDLESVNLRKNLSSHGLTFPNTVVTTQPLPTNNQLPPTPDSDKASTPLPAIPPISARRKPLGLGLPSNPRSKDGPITPKHMRGKSSTGYNLMKSNGQVLDTKQSIAPAVTTVDTITPGATPSPKDTPIDENKSPSNAVLSRAQIRGALQELDSPVSPLLPDNDNNRPFSFESIPPAAPTQQYPQQSSYTVAPAPPPTSDKSFTSPSAAEPALSYPPRTTSRPGAQPISQPQPQPPSQASSRPSSQTGLKRSSRTSLRSAFEARSRSRSNSRNGFQTSSRPGSQNQATIAFPFPQPTTTPPPSKLPPMPITNAHLSCYARHSQLVASTNKQHPMACMVCSQHRQEQFRACHWCHLRICISCCVELERTPGRDLRVMLEKRKEGGAEVNTAPGVLVWGAEGEYE